jgi:hypothetical protein
MPEASETLLSAAQAKHLAELLKPVPKKATGDLLWDLRLFRLNQMIFTAWSRIKKDAATVAQTDSVLDALAQRLLDTYDPDADLVKEQRIVEISDALQEARRFLGVVTFRKKPPRV